MRNVGVIVGIAVTITVLTCVGWVWYTHSFTRGSESVDERAVTELPVLPLSQTYRNESLRLTFSYPAGYSVREVGGGEGGSILIENPEDASRGIQIAVSPYTDTDTSITAERVMRDIPDMEVRDPLPVSLGVAGQGISFKSDNEDFGGDSREVWFIVSGRLYQISTYATYDTVLQAIMGTWSFF